MKVLMTADAVGGVWHYAMELIRALEPHGVEVVLATMGGIPDADQLRQACQLRNLQLCSGDYKLEWMDSPWRDVAAAGDWLLGLEARHDPDVIHLNGYAHGVLPWRAPLLIVGHSCVLSWWRAVKGADAPAAWDRYRCQIAAGLRRADLVIAPSRAMLNSLLHHYGPLPPARVIHNTRSPDDFKPAPKEPFILAAGRLWDQAKNLQALDESAPALPWPLYIAGDSRGPDGDSVSARNARALGRLTTESLSQWLGQAAIFAHPARYEPFGLSVLEAGLSRCALVLGDIPSLREIWGDAAVFVPRADSRAIETAIRGLIVDPMQRELFASRALARARTYAPQAMSGDYLAVYQQLLTHGVAQPSRQSGGPMRIVMFYHSLLSDWNHGNAHFLRGIVSELLFRGHDVKVYEPQDAWSLQNLRSEYGDAPIEQFHRAYPGLKSSTYALGTLDLDSLLGGADLVIVHEWNEHELVRRIGEHRTRRGAGGYHLLFHDTHHRIITAPQAMSAYDLSGYDGVLAFGEVLRELYLANGFTRRAWTWHEAADTRLFRPIAKDAKDGDLLWVGNWGDEERTAELHEFLLGPVKSLSLSARVHGVRYPDAARSALAEAGIQYSGWLANYDAPDAFARFRVTVHVPRRPYVAALPGIPTIRVFEALACGIPLICAPWRDSERLFTPGRDFLVARDGCDMRKHLRAVLNDPYLAHELAAHGHRTILSRHTCAHRVDELMDIFQQLTADEMPRRTKGRRKKRKLEKVEL